MQVITSHMLPEMRSKVPLQGPQVWLFEYRYEPDAQDVQYDGSMEQVKQFVSHM
jgi:hypothetical protein